MVEKQTRSINRSVPVPGLSHKPHVCPAPHSSSPLKPELGPPPSYTGGKSGGPCQATLVDCPSVRVYGCPQELRMCFLAMVVPLSSALQENSRISKQHRQALWQTHPWAVSPGAPRGGTQPGGNGHPYQGLGFLPGACALPLGGAAPPSAPARWAGHTASSCISALLHTAASPDVGGPLGASSWETGGCLITGTPRSA